MILFFLTFIGHKASPKTPESPASESNSKEKEGKKENDKELEKSMSSRIESLTIQEDAKEGVEDEEDFPVHPYERLKTTSADPVSDIDVTRREVSWNQQTNFICILMKEDLSSSWSML